MAEWCTCYVLEGKTDDGKVQRYYGQCGVKHYQTSQEAADWRNEKHKSCRKWCLSHVDPGSMKCTALGNQLCPEDALLQETVLMVIAYQTDETVRGGPYVLRHLLSSQRSELGKLEAICKLRTYSEQRKRVAEIAKSMPLMSSLRAHVEDRCFQCKRPGWKTCPCRGQRKNNLVPGGNSSNSSSSSASSSKLVSLLKQPKEVFAMKRRASGKRPPKARAKHYMKRVVASPMKRWSGKSQSGARRLKDKIRTRKLVKNSDDAKKFRHGKKFAENRVHTNAQHYMKRTARARRTERAGKSRK